MSTEPVSTPPFLNLPPEVLQRHAKATRTGGFLAILIGIAAMAIPGVFTLGIEIFIGTLLLIAGMTQMFAAFSSIGSRHWFLALFTGLLSAVVGVLFLTNPLKGIMTLTALLGIFFLVSGVFRLIYSFQISSRGSAGVSIFNGIISIILGGLVLSGWPESSPFILGIFLGIDLIFLGFFLLTYSSACKKIGEKNNSVDESTRE